MSDEKLLPNDEEIKKALGTFIEALIENLNTSCNHSSDAFEIYEMHLRGEIHKNVDEFKARFIKGYFKLTQD